MAFKHGRLAESWLGGLDASVYLNSFDFDAKTDTGDTTTFKSTWHSALTGVSKASVVAHGLYDPTQSAFQPLTADDQVLTYGPAGLSFGDLARLFLAEQTSYKEASPVGGIVAFDWAAESDKVVGFGATLVGLGSQGVGVFTGTGDGLMTSAQSTNGLVAHLHVTSMTGGDTHTAKLQDATSLNGVYADIAGGAFTDITAAGAQRLVVSGTIRAFVRIVFTVVGHAATFGAAAART